MTSEIESSLFVDPQTVPAEFCPQCGKEVYPPGYWCPSCARREENDLERIER